MIACHLNTGIPKLRVLSNAESLPRDGAYPRRERRGIAPVQRIMFEITHKIILLLKYEMGKF